MPTPARTPDEYLAAIDDPARRAVLIRLRDTIVSHLPEGFEETINYGMISYVVPHALYPAGYHCDPKLPLPFVAIAGTKSGYSLYHMGLYADEALLAWFTDEYPKHSTARLDMGKSCIRFKKAEHIPFDLVGQLIERVSVADWVATYEAKLK
jgi:uncharacterized protein YdhG (YjbR/CyaY superfamily)